MFEFLFAARGRFMREYFYKKGPDKIFAYLFTQPIQPTQSS